MTAPNSVGYSPAVTAPARVPEPGTAQVPYMLDRLEDSVTRLGATVEGLILRLGAVLTEEVVQAGTPVAEVSGPSLVPMAERLAGYAERIDQVQRYLASANDRLEL